jgi:hypothetical protein
MQYLSIAEAEERDEKSLWVLNTSGDVEMLPQAGEINLSVPKLNGSSSDSLFIPLTWLPVDLTDQIPRDQLLSASEFRKAVQRRIISIISSEDAASLLSRDGAEEERHRLDELANHIRRAGAARTIADSGAEVRVVGGFREEDAETDVPVKVVGGNADKPDLSASFAIFFDKLQALPDLETLNAIRTRRKFSKAELTYLSKHIHDKPKTLAAIGKQLGIKRAH